MLAHTRQQWGQWLGIQRFGHLESARQRLFINTTDARDGGTLHANASKGNLSRGWLRPPGHTEGSPKKSV
jgi:hypothetical protein